MSDKRINEPCPFCRSTDLEVGMSYLARAYRVRCNGCFAQGPTATTQDGAIRLWNSRQKEDK